MATWDDVRRIALALPHVEEKPSARGRAFWLVKGKSFAWERPLRGTDREALGASAPDGPILGARVEHLGIKDALLGDEPEVFFTTPHFDGHPSVLIRLEKIDLEELREVLTRRGSPGRPSGWPRSSSTRRSSPRATRWSSPASLSAARATRDALLGQRPGRQRTPPQPSHSRDRESCAPECATRADRRSAGRDLERDDLRRGR
jgi:hypothetical protein